MIDDTDNNSNITKIAAGIANAEQTMGESENTNFIPNVGPSTGDVPNRLIAQTSKVVWHRFMNPLDVTDGLWKTLPIWTDQYLNWSSGKMESKNIGNVFDISMYTAMGGAHLDITDVHDMTTATATFDPNQINSYTHGRLKSVGVHLKNFLVQVERDSSGGVQWKDEPVFEIQLFPATNYLPSVTTIVTSVPAYTYTTTLKEGYKSGCSFTCGVFEKKDSIVAKVPISGTVYYTYPNIGEWLCDELPSPATLPAIYYRGNPHAHGLAYHAYIRLVNVPHGLTNIKVDLSYSAELTCLWDSYGHVLSGEIALHVDGTIVSNRISVEIKRKLNELEKYCKSDKDKRLISKYRKACMEELRLGSMSMDIQ